ncbi:MAG TPA: amidohydrolase family protein [Acidimicrobiales bacterium]|nr:amidohydrolase family protein [Acidimicrobiales bacterium]
MILRNVEVGGEIADVTVDDGRDDEIDGAGGALIPGLHDHHVHLNAMAAAAQSVTVADLARTDRLLPPGEWLRAVGYHESVDGPLDRAALDRIVPTRPVRVQHASGAMWVINSAGLAALGIDVDDGRLYGADAWLRSRLAGELPDLTRVSDELAGFGVTGVTDATPGLTSIGPVSQRVRLLGDGKIVVADHDPPPIDELADRIRSARPGPVAFHCASRLGLVLALAAVEIAGARRGDRIEHGAVMPDDARATIRALGITVVTQPGFVHERGDRYLADVDVDDQPHLWRCGSLLRDGIRVAGSSDAPYGSADPWRAMRAAATRRTASGAPIGLAERVTPQQALDLFLSPLDDPGGRPRRIEVGAVDVCLLRVPLATALADPDAVHVRMTVQGVVTGCTVVVRN